MTIEIDVRVPAPGAVRALFQRILAGLGLQRPRLALVEDLRDDYLRAIQQGFDRETDPYGQRWRPSLRAQLCGGRTLTDTGRLRRSLSARLTGETIRFSSAVPYAGIHQTGGVIRARRAKYLRFRLCNGQWVSKKSVRIPARPFLPAGRGLPPAWLELARRRLGQRVQAVNR